MRLTALHTLLGILLVLPWSASAGTVKIEDWTQAGHFKNNSPDGGGPFLATTTGGPLGNRTFMTFCLEFNENIALGNTFSYELSDSAMNGGTGGGPLGDPMSEGNLNYSGSYIQEAIWYLEQERTSLQISSFALALAERASTAAAHATTGWAALAALGHSVQALNLKNLSGNLKQDQIVWTFTPTAPPPAVPDGDASTLVQLIAVAWIGAIGYLFVGLPRRRRAA
jgi:hypothetical protein